MLASTLKPRPVIRQVQADTLQTLATILDDGVNLAVWQRKLAAQVEDFGRVLLSLNQPLAEALLLELPDERSPPNLQGLASSCSDLEGYEGFISDVSWLVSAFACLLGAKRVGLRLRILDKAMCPRFHVDHVPVRMITTYAGVGSEWLKEGAMDRRQLGMPAAEPVQGSLIQQTLTGEVALLKGEKWHGNEGFGLIHRSPQLMPGERRLILTLDWLA